MAKKQKVIEIDGVEYNLIAHKGSGGSGSVWAAESAGNRFAIKFFKTESLTTDKKARFEQEIKFCKSSNHKNIIKVIADGEYDGSPCYVMPHYTRTLRDVIQEEIDTDLLLKFLLDICSALKYIHRKGIKHRDIKPENILIDGNTLVLADFGVAHFKDHHITKKGDLLANRNYTAPEQKLRNNALNVDEAADIYAFGLIINECFTKQNPAGTAFELIADSYPLLYELDHLVENMIKQQSSDRFTIKEVETQLKFINKKIRQNLQEVNLILRESYHNADIKKPVLNKIYKRACEDILVGKYAFRELTNHQLQGYNLNWHLNITYSVDEILFNLYVQEQIFEICKRKFEHESKVYRANNWHIPLDLINNSEHKFLYKQLADTLAKYDLKEYGVSLLDLSGLILKYFASCADYHCKEILSRIKDIEESAEHRLNNAPILYIVSALKNGIIENIDFLLKPFDGLGGRFEFNFEEHVFIHWKKTDYDFMNDDHQIQDKFYIEQKEEISQILLTFRKQWNVNTYKLDDKSYSIKFTTYKSFKKFEAYALQLSKPYYIFEGDVLSLVHEPNIIGDMVELKLTGNFHIRTTLAQILGLKLIHA